MVPHAPHAEHRPTQRVACCPHLAHTASDLVFAIGATIPGPSDNNLPFRLERRRSEGDPRSIAES
jgi:hypothetical protein